MLGFSWLKRSLSIVGVKTPYEYDKTSSSKTEKNVELRVGNRVYGFEDSFADGEKSPTKKDYLHFVKTYEEQLTRLQKMHGKDFENSFPQGRFPEGKRIFSNTNLGRYKTEEDQELIAKECFDSAYAMDKHGFVAKDHNAREHARMNGKIYGEPAQEVGFQFTGVEGNTPRTCLAFLRHFRDTFPLDDHAGKQYSIEGKIPDSDAKTTIPLQSFMNEQLAKHGLGIVEGHAASVTPDKNQSQSNAHIGSLRSKTDRIDFHFHPETSDRSSALENTSKACMDFMRNFGASVDLGEFYGKRLNISLADTLENNLVKNDFDGIPIRVEEKQGPHGKEHVASLNAGELGEKIDFHFAPTQPHFGFRQNRNSPQDCRRFVREFKDVYEGSLSQLAGKTYTIAEPIPQGSLQSFVQNIYANSLERKPLDPNDVTIQEEQGPNGKEHVASLRVGEEGEHVDFHFQPNPRSSLAPNSIGDIHRFLSTFHHEMGQSKFLYAGAKYTVNGRIPQDRHHVVEFMKNTLTQQGLPAAAPNTGRGGNKQDMNARPPSSYNSR